MIMKIPADCLRVAIAGLIVGGNDSLVLRKITAGAMVYLDVRKNAHVIFPSGRHWTLAELEI